MTRSIAAALVLVPLVCAAQGVTRPDVKVGDSWTYRSMDYDANQRRGKYTMRVVLAQDGVIKALSVRSGREGESDTTYTADWNTVKLRRVAFNPHNSLFKFPLRVGETYPVAFDSFRTSRPKHGRTEDTHSRNERTVKVVGWEEVVVPAGKFRALQIVSEGFLSFIDNGRPRSRIVREVVWYVPEIKRWAKKTYETQPIGAGALRVHNGEELLAYELK
jgi:hypothetical protein